ncbi:unnamed protein product [Adineta steineri]|uniref:Uncharacterized protein n=1 Tax=Adineta steineri TaxID=433720 RepID=A0A814YF92_9BILA|nr:unnamed protein product [Adineta steineri]CAF1229786.1 unnamed protein product [Adineta steineri]CAF3579425.1 unnamed protein product [Adineta steineri]CAF3715218.1 unnamed protein product [Adineta steineri]
MNCKLSKESLIELQLIRPELMNDDAPCPCCEQRVTEHQNGRRIGRIPFTCYNICPRMRRASRKSSTVGIFVAIGIAVLTLLLSSYINYLISIRGEKYEGRSDSLNERKKGVTSINNTLYTNDSLINNDLSYDWPFMYDNINQRNENHPLLFIIVLFISMLIIIIIVFIFVCICSSKFFPHSTDRKTNNDKQGFLVPVNIYTSVMTQTSVDL